MTAEERLTENLRLHLINEQWVHLEVGSLIRHAEARAARRRRELLGPVAPCDVPAAVQATRRAAGRALEEWVRELALDADPRAEGGVGAAIAADLLSVALAFVDWPALAECLGDAA